MREMTSDPHPGPSSPTHSARMAGFGQAPSGHEFALRRRLHAQGLRYRVQVRVPDRPRRTIDVAFARWRVAVFVDGCFWHRCPQHASSARKNGEWWSRKLQRNVDRDADTNNALHAAGWCVVRIWEHEDLECAVDRVSDALAESGHPRCRSALSRD